MQAASVLGECTVVAIFCIVGFSDENAIGFEKAGKVIDMTVSIVTDKAIVKPNYRIRPKARSELLFNLGWRGVAVTRGIKQDDFGSQYITNAVTLNSAAFENLVKFVTAKAKLLRNPCGGTIVFLLFGEFVTPGIVAPVRNTEFLLMIMDEKEWTIIAYPNIIGLVIVEFDC